MFYCSLSQLKFYSERFCADAKERESHFLFSWRQTPAANERAVFGEWAGSARTVANRFQSERWSEARDAGGSSGVGVA